MNYGKIKKNDIANGPGVRVSLFVSGCRNHCPGCFNPETWDFGYGEPFTKKTEKEIIKALLPLLKRIRITCPGKDVWLYTGYTYEQIRDSEILKWVDVLVDGPFIEAEKDISLAFRGSRNQRIIPLRKGKPYEEQDG